MNSTVRIFLAFLISIFLWFVKAQLYRHVDNSLGLETNRRKTFKINNKTWNFRSDKRRFSFKWRNIENIAPHSLLLFSILTLIVFWLGPIRLIATIVECLKQTFQSSFGNGCDYFIKNLTARSQQLAKDIEPTGPSQWEPWTHERITLQAGL